MSVDREFIERNEFAREQLKQFVEGLSDDDLERPLGRDGTVLALLAHMAFWEWFRLVRWEKREQNGVMVALNDQIVDLMNDTLLVQASATPPREAVRQLLVGADRLDRKIKSLAPELIGEALAAGRTGMLDTSLHRREHLDEIEAALTS